VELKNPDSIAVNFVDLALTHMLHEWQFESVLPEGGEAVLVATLQSVGFETVSGIVPGKLFGEYRDQGGSRTGEKYPLNKDFSFTAVKRDGKIHERATHWLDSMIRQAGHKQSNGMSKNGILVEVFVLLEQSKPLEPILLTVDGDFMQEYPRDKFFEHTRDDHTLSSCVGIHKYCGGFMDHKETTETNSVIICRSCLLRILLPSEIKTYGELREYSAQQISGHNSRIPKAKYVVHHDDPPCEERLVINGYCLACGIHPDTQSKKLWPYCPKCDVPLQDLRCPTCQQTYQLP